MEHFDVIIVGAGPAGLSAAERLAENKVKVLCLDKKQELGAPKRCAEGLGLGWFKRLNIKPDPQWAVQPIKGAKLYSPKGTALKLESPEPAGYVLERKVFEKWLARNAARKGALIKAKNHVLEAKRKDGKLVLKVKEFDEIKEYSCDLVIAADGVDSRIARYLGLNTTNKLIDIDSGFQYEMAGIKLKEPHLLHLFFGNEIAPRGYCWYFCKGKDSANVGIGIGGNVEKTAKEYLDKFIASRPELKNASIIEVNAGAVPVGGFLESMVKDNLIAVGDAAHQVDPIHGGGIGIAIEGARLGADIAIKAIKAKDFSEKFLSQYNQKWYEQRGNQLKKRLKGRLLLERLTDGDFEYLAASLSIEEVMKIASGELDKKAKFVLFGKKLVQRPKLLSIMIKYLK